MLPQERLCLLLACAAVEGLVLGGGVCGGALEGLVAGHSAPPAIKAP